MKQLPGSAGAESLGDEATHKLQGIIVVSGPLKTVETGR